MVSRVSHLTALICIVALGVSPALNKFSLKSLYTLLGNVVTKLYLWSVVDLNNNIGVVGEK